MKVFFSDNAKVPKVPPTTLKRKYSEPLNPENVKRPKPSPLEFMMSDVSTSMIDKSKKPITTVSVEDATDEEDERNEGAEEFAPGNDADYFVEEDEDGRFFGGGLTKEQKDILNIFEEGAGDEATGDVSIIPCSFPFHIAMSKADQDILFFRFGS